MGKYTGRIVAAAILLAETDSEGTGIHYEQLTELVVNSGLSGLTENGGVTPYETLSRDMREHPDLFERMDIIYPDEGHPKGYYIVKRGAAQNHPDIINAKEDYIMLKQTGRLMFH